MTAWLVSARIQAEVNHNSTRILGSNNIVATISVGLVISEELIINLLVDINTMGLDLDSLQGLEALRVDKVALANLRQLRGSASKGVSADQSRGKDSVVTSANVTSKAFRLHGASNGLINQAGKTIPIAPEVNVTGSNSQTADSGLGDVELGSHTGIQGLNGPLKVAQENTVVRNLLFLSLESVNADERETNSLNVNIVNLRVNKDVVDVKLALVDVGGDNTRITARQLHGADSSITSIRSNGSAVSGTIGISNYLSGKTKGNVTSGSSDDIIGGSEIDSDKALTIRNRHGGDGKAGILVEPEQQRNPPVLHGLSGLRSLGAVNNETHLAGVVSGVDGRASSSSTVDVKKTNSGSTIGGSTRNGGEVSESLNRDFLTDKALPTGQLTGSNAELLVEHNGLRSVIIKGVSVNLELDLGEKAFTRVFNIANEVLADRGGAIENSSLLVNVVVGVASVGVKDGRILGGANGIGGGDVLVGKADVSGEGGKAGNSAGRSSSNLCVDNHVMEEITELRDREGDGLTERGRS